MKKLLMSAAVCGLALSATPALADINLELGGFTSMYGVFSGQDERTGTEVNSFDLLRYTEVHIGGENTFDNGLVVGVHFELDADDEDGFETDESYAYFSGGWGRVNLGAEDGAAYLLQVAAPSADSNIDGLRQYIQPVNYFALVDQTTTDIDAGTVGAGALADGTDIELSYDHDVSGHTDKITYLSPVFNGFQAGVSYTPDGDSADDLGGVGLDSVDETFGATYEGGLRYEGSFNNVGVIFGAGYSLTNLEGSDTTFAAYTPSDDREAWNVGADFDIGAFGVGVVYTEDDFGNRYQESSMTAAAAGRSAMVVGTEEKLVVGVDYTTGPFKIGGSYLTADNTFGVQNLDTKRYTGGVVYTYGPGLTFRGSVSFLDHDLTDIRGTGLNEADATSVLLGTQIDF